MEKDTNLRTADSVPRQRQREDQRTMTFKDKKTSWWNYPTPCKEVPKRRPPTSYPQQQLQNWTHRFDADSASQLLHLC